MAPADRLANTESGSRRGALLAHLMGALAGGFQVSRGSIPELETSGPQRRPRLPADLVARALRSVSVDNVVRPGLCLDGLEVVGDLNLSYIDFSQELEFTNCEFTGSIDLSQARVAALRLHQSTLTSVSDEYAVNARDLEVGGSLVLPAQVNRPINLAGAKIHGNLAGCPRLVSKVDDSWVLDAMGIEIGGVISVGLPEHIWGGAINLFGAEVVGGVRIAGILQQPADGFALDLSWAAIGEELDLNLRVHDVGSPNDVVLRIKNASVKRDLTIRLVLADGSVDATDTVVEGCFAFDQQGLLPTGALLISGLGAGEIDVGDHDTDLPDVRELTRWKVEDISGHLRSHAKAARDWLDGAGIFAAQPWEELAKVYKANGQPADARRIQYWAARRATRHSPPGTRLARNLYWATTGHGYYPLLALVWLVVLFTAAFALTNLNHDRFTTLTTVAIGRANESNTPATKPQQPQREAEASGRVTAADCRNPQWDTPCLNDVEYAMSLTLSPVTGSLPWQPPHGWVSAALLLIRTLSWVFVALLLAGVTGLLRAD